MMRSLGVVAAIALATGTAHAGEKSVHDGKEVVDAVGAAAAATVDRVGDALEGTDLDGVFDRIEAAAPTLRKVAEGALRRARRSVAIGPTLGIAGGYAPSASTTDGMISVGLGFEKFDIPIAPTFDNLKALVKERAKVKLRQLVLDRLQGRPPAPDELERLAAEVWSEAVAEVLGLANVRPRTMEKPQLSVAIEANRYLDASAWAGRLRLGFGVWRFTVAGTAALAATDPSTSAFLGVDISAHFLMSKQPRASVLDVFLRMDFEVRNRDTANTDTVLLGARYLLDVL